jgi:hypothetical protein
MTAEIDPDRDGDAPEAGEAVHLPEPSYLPVVVALGITLAVVGVVVHPAIVAIGVLILLVSVVRWVRQTREEMADLPLEH